MHALAQVVLVLGESDDITRLGLAGHGEGEVPVRVAVDGLEAGADVTVVKRACTRMGEAGAAMAAGAIAIPAAATGIAVKAITLDRRAFRILARI
jgi:hypothetical protein